MVLYAITKKKLDVNDVKKIIMLVVSVLLFSFPAFSYDIFNYIATAKVTYLYKENPYVVMPIEIRNEPMLAFMHAANKTALYGPLWILLTSIPYLIGMHYLLLTILAFKVFVLFFYIGMCLLIWKMSKNILSLAMFALNPLVLVETLVSGHNDVVMMFFALFSFYELSKKRIVPAMVLLLLSIGIKYATIFLVPVFVYVCIAIVRKRSLDWRKIWLWSALSLYAIFLLSPIREEIYSWYFIWPLTFISLLGSFSAITAVSLAFTGGLLLRFAPYIYSGSWSGMTPMVKLLVTFIPPSFAGIWYTVTSFHRKLK